MTLKLSDLDQLAKAAYSKDGDVLLVSRRSADILAKLLNQQPIFYYGIPVLVYDFGGNRHTIKAAEEIRRGDLVTMDGRRIPPIHWSGGFPHRHTITAEDSRGNKAETEFDVEVT